jgi:hypothetical protein
MVEVIRQKDLQLAIIVLQEHILLVALLNAQNAQQEPILIKAHLIA